MILSECKKSETVLARHTICGHVKRFAAYVPKDIIEYRTKTRVCVKCQIKNRQVINREFTVLGTRTPFDGNSEPWLDWCDRTKTRHN